MRITSKGQVTIPAHIREQAGLLPHTEVDFTYNGEAVQIVRVPSRQGTSRDQRQRLVASLRGRGDVASHKHR